MTAHYQGQPEFDLKGKTVLELRVDAASLPGLTAAMLGASRVVLIDIEPLIPGLSKNMEANGLGNVVQLRKLVWGSNESFSKFDIVLMSDVFFDPDEMGALAKALKGVCGDHTRVSAATNIRSWTGEHLTVLADQGFRMPELPGLVPMGLTGSATYQHSDSFAVFCLAQLSEAGHLPPAFYYVAANA